MKIVKYFFSLSLVLAVLVSCGPKVETNKRVSRDLSAYNSFSLLPNQDTIRNSELNNAFVNEVVIDEIVKNMKTRGYMLERNQPDLLIYYHLMLDEEMAVNASPAYTNYSYYTPGYYVGPYYRNYMYNNYFTVPRLAGTDIDQVPYKEGTIVIDLIDRRTNQIVWRGKASDIVYFDNLEEELRDYVNAIFENYPQ